MRKALLARRVSLAVTAALIGGMLYGVGAQAPASADTVSSARGFAYGVSENALTEPDAQAPVVESVVPPPPDQAQNRRVQHEEDVLVAVSTLVRVAQVESDACVEEGVSAKLQAISNQVAGAGDVRRVEVTPQQGKTDECMFLGRRAPSPTGSPGATATAAPTAAPTASPTATGSPGAPTGPNCETGTVSAVGTCAAVAPLWNARGYAFLVDTIVDDLEAEAVAACEGGKEVFQTGARFGTVSGLLGADPVPNERLNPLDLNLVDSAVVIFWETNWDPRTNTTTDGSDTVYANALHIFTPTEEIILGHAEASAECPDAPTAPPTQPTITVPPTVTPPEGGFPRDISLSPSKNVVLYSKIFTLSGAVTPATQFQTPRSCVEGVTLTLRRDPIGGPEEFVDVGTVVTDSEGNFTFNYQADLNSQWLAFIDKDNPTDCALATSSARPVLVKPFVRLKLSQRFVQRGKTVRMRASLEPCLDNPGTRMKLKRSFDAKLVEIDTKALDANCQVEFFVRADFKEAVFQASWPKQSSALQTGQSRPKPVQTRERR